MPETGATLLMTQVLRTNHRVAEHGPLFQETYVILSKGLALPDPETGRSGLEPAAR